MGCDFSGQVKEEFDEKYSDSVDSEERIRKKIHYLNSLLLGINNSPCNNLQVTKIKNDLIDQLERIHLMIEGLKKNKDISHLLSISSSSSIEDIVRPLEKAEIDSKKMSMRSPAKFDTTESILEDPEIMALIIKNRSKLMRKQTGN